MDRELLRRYVDESQADRFYTELVAAMNEFEIDSTMRQAAFLANIFHESAGLKHLEENLNYSADALCRVWPSRFSRLNAPDYARNPQKIANKVYAMRMGNGAEISGDGWRFRGAGLMQITGRDNHSACGRYFGMAVDGVPGWLKTPEGACRSAGWFWQMNTINHFADDDDFDGVCDMINRGHKTEAAGDAIGYVDRLNTYRALKRDMGVV